MKQSMFKYYHRQARLGLLGTLSAQVPSGWYQWFLREVYDLRFPHIGDSRHNNLPRTFDSLRYGGRTHARLVEFHQAQGWVNSRHKPLLRLWLERKAKLGIKKYRVTAGYWPEEYQARFGENGSVHELTGDQITEAIMTLGRASIHTRKDGTLELEFENTYD
jgi:hypothetical protein